MTQLSSTVRYGYRDNEQDSFQQGKQRRDWLDHRVAQYDSKSQNPGESRDHVDVAVEKPDKMIMFYRFTFILLFIHTHHEQIHGAHIHKKQRTAPSLASEITDI